MNARMLKDQGKPVVQTMGGQQTPKGSAYCVTPPWSPDPRPRPLEDKTPGQTGAAFLGNRSISDPISDPNPNRVRVCRVNQIPWRRLSDNLLYFANVNRDPATKPITKKSLAKRFSVSPKTFDRWCCDRWTLDGNKGRSTKRLGALPTEDQLQVCWRLAVEGFESKRGQIMLDHGKWMGISYELMQGGEITPSMFGERCAMSTAKADRAVRELEDRLFQVWSDVYLFSVVKANERASRAVERPDRPPKPLEVDIHPVIWYTVPEWHERAS